MTFAIYEVMVGGGAVAMSPIPLHDTDYKVIADWAPSLVVSLTQPQEGDVTRLAALPWVHVPVADFGVPDGDALDDVIARAVTLLRGGGRVLFHCKGGCGRSGMAVLRVSHCFDVPDAPHKLRTVRPCAVETQAQMDWAMRPVI